MKRRFSTRPSRSLLLLVATGVAIGLIFLGTPLPQSSLLSAFAPQPASAQYSRVQGLWRQVYERLPDFPLENQYVRKDTGETDPDNTLISRLIRYHIYIKSRPYTYRLDWKITLADYLGVNDRMLAATYPSADTLRTNPMEGDIAAIRSLTRAQRDALVQALVEVLAPAPSEEPTASPAPSVAPSPTPAPAATPAPRRSSPLQPLPQPGDADLLRPQ